VNKKKQKNFVRWVGALGAELVLLVQFFLASPSCVPQTRLSGEAIKQSLHLGSFGQGRRHQTNEVSLLLFVHKKTSPYCSFPT
jgi:hypothetical protein